MSQPYKTIKGVSIAIIVLGVLGAIVAALIALMGVGMGALSTDPDFMAQFEEEWRSQGGSAYDTYGAEEAMVLSGGVLIGFGIFGLVLKIFAIIVGVIGVRNCENQAKGGLIMGLAIALAIITVFMGTWISTVLAIVLAVFANKLKKEGPYGAAAYAAPGYGAGYAGQQFTQQTYDPNQYAQYNQQQYGQQQYNQYGQGQYSQQYSQPAQGQYSQQYAQPAQQPQAYDPNAYAQQQYQAPAAPPMAAAAPVATPVAPQADANVKPETTMFEAQPVQPSDYGITAEDMAAFDALEADAANMADAAADAADKGTQQ